MRYEEIKALDDELLQAEIVNLKKEHFNLRFQRASGKVENTARIRQIRRDVARVKTEQAARKNKAD